jgi:hypothetical protein
VGLRELTPHLFASPPDRALAEYLGGPFPPGTAVPAIPGHLLATVRALSPGRPGDPVRFGYFPSPETKLACLALARAYPAAAVLHAAERAYEGNRGGAPRAYHAHEALACALAHPEIDATHLAERYAAHGRTDRGHRSRHKTHQVLEWARRSGYGPREAPCPCGHERFSAPTTRQQALDLAGHWTQVRHLLGVLRRDPEHWLALLRCTHCGRLWAEDNMSSGHATLLFGYPLPADADADPDEPVSLAPLTLSH